MKIPFTPMHYIKKIINKNARLRCLIPILLLQFIFQIPSISSLAQTWSAPVQVVDPNAGTGGNIGQYSKLLVVNGIPAMAYFDATRTNLVYVRATDASGTTWGRPITLDSIGTVGHYLSFQIVNGNPAITYYDATNFDLKYVRATDASGTAWGTPLSIDVTGDVGQYTSLQIVNGNPTITYYDFTNGNLKYVRATNASGTGWGTPITIDVTGDVGKFPSLQIVNGFPAISYYDVTNSNLKYIRASDINGTAWGTAINIDVTGDVGQYISLQIVIGIPAIAYYDVTNGYLKYVRANDVNGTAWAIPIFIDVTANGGQYCTLQMVNGWPAVSYSSNNSLTTNELRYISANDAFGGTWGTPITIDNTGDEGQYASLQIVNGFPAIAYYESGMWGSMKYVRAANLAGTAWSTPKYINAAGNVGKSPSLQIVNGKPAIAYFDASNSKLLYVRSTNTVGTVWGAPFSVNASQDGGLHSSLQIVNGFPAIAYYGVGQLIYVRANDADGTSWGSPITIDLTAFVGQNPCLQIVNGNPAVVYYDLTNGNLKYVRAKDPSGTSWNTPKNIDITGDVGEYGSLQIVNGFPAISYYDNTNGDLKYVRANDINGGIWGIPIAIDVTGNVGQYSTLQVVNGFPAIAYYDFTNLDLKYVRANDAVGTAWGTPLLLDGTGTFVGEFASLQIVNGNPAISYYDKTNTNLKYIRASNTSGTAWSLPSTLDAVQSTGLLTSMIGNVNGAGIAYYSSSQALPFYINGFTGVLPVSFTSIKAWELGSNIAVEWKVENEINIQQYEVEKSTDGLLFATAFTKTINGSSQSSTTYNWLDTHSALGDNYYRIRSIGSNGKTEYSTIVVVNKGKGKSAVSFYPNPITGGIINLQMKNMPQGFYTVRLINSLGQQLMTTAVDHAAGSSTQSIQLPNKLAKGKYTLLVIAPDKTQTSLNVIW